jgi:2-dehydro-3-deoxyphosphogluconate aldolase/(4S)-4-hydroxy-2-oxoglutarate aldolase
MSQQNENLRVILDVGIVPVVRATSSAEATRIAEAVRNGGIKVIEITMTVPGALEVIEEVSGRFGKEVLIGAGTVLDAETARLAILAGAEFIVSPCLGEELIRMGKRYGKVVIPGAMTPTEILEAWELGADIVKVFPVDQLGGPAYVKAIKAPLPQIPLLPTGGVNIKNIAEYIKAGASAVAVGGELIDKKAVAEGKFEIVTEKAKEFVKVVSQAKVAGRN